MELLNSKTITSSVSLYTIILFIIYIKKPSFFFDNSGSLIKFGINENNTLFSLHMFILLLSIFVFSISLVINELN